MRFKMSAASQFQAIANATGVTIPSISNHPYLGHHIDQIYYAYPRFLMARFEAEVRDRLYFPWEKIQDREPLYVYISTTHHWPLAEVRQMNESHLLDVLRPELQGVRIPAQDVQELLGALGDLVPADLRADLEARVAQD